MTLFLLIVIGVIALVALLISLATTDRPGTNAVWATVLKWVIIMSFAALVANTIAEAIR